MTDFNKPTKLPAFPSGYLLPEHQGITMRDYFAAKAMQGMLSEPSLRATPEEFATESYKVADAMLKARQE
jgi:hypothetical protein